MKSKTYMLFNNCDNESHAYGDIRYIAEIIQDDFDPKVKPTLASVRKFIRNQITKRNEHFSFCLLEVVEEA